MTFDDLELFWALAERQSVTDAAKAVSISQPTASRRLQTMEQELGSRLVERDSHPLKLTPFGFLFLDFADDVLKRYRGLRLTAEQNHSVVGRLTIATSSSPAARLVTRWVADFIAAQPGVHMELWEMNTREVEERIVGGDALIGFMGMPSDNADVTSWPIAEDEIILLTPHRPPFNHLHRPVNWEDVHHLPFVVRRPGSGTQEVVQSALQTRGWPEPTHVVLEVGTAAALIDAVESGLGAGFVSRELLFRRDLRHSSPLSVRGLSLTRPFFLAYHTNKVTTHAIARQFLRYAAMRLSAAPTPKE